MIADPAFYYQLNNQYLLTYSRKGKLPGSLSSLRHRLSICQLNYQYRISYRQEKALEHTWKPCLIFYHHHHQIINILFRRKRYKRTWAPVLIADPTFCCQSNNQYPISYSLQKEKVQTYLETFLDCGPGFLLSIKQSISVNIQKKREVTWKPFFTTAPTFYLSVKLSVPYIVPSRKSFRSYLEALLDFLSSSSNNQYPLQKKELQTYLGT